MTLTAPSVNDAEAGLWLGRQCAIFAAAFRAGRVAGPIAAIQGYLFEDRCARLAWQALRRIHDRQEPLTDYAILAELDAIPDFPSPDGAASWWVSNVNGIIPTARETTFAARALIRRGREKRERNASICLREALEAGDNEAADKQRGELQALLREPAPATGHPAHLNGARRVGNLWGGFTERKRSRCS